MRKYLVSSCAYITNFYKFSQLKKFKEAQKRLQKLIDEDQRSSSLDSIIINKRKQQLESIKQYQKNLPIQEAQRYINQNIVQIALFMKHDQWQSQYINAILNYQKIGFRRVSDLAMLDRYSYALNITHLSQKQKWPYAKINIALDPAIHLRGTKQIYQFFKQNYYFQKPIDRQSSIFQTLQKYINQSVNPHIQAIFWHPLLTFQYTFHTNRTSYNQGMKSYLIWSILYRNFLVIMKRIFANIRNIRNNQEIYKNSKQNLTKSLKQLQKLIDASGDYFGGERPNHIDFYLFSVLKTKSGSYHFLKYLQNQVGGNLWRWWIRMNMQTQYDPQRITLK